MLEFLEFFYPLTHNVMLAAASNSNQTQNNNYLGRSGKLNMTISHPIYCKMRMKICNASRGGTEELAWQR